MINRNKTAVVTGGCGFIGSYLVKRLINLGWKVKVVDQLIRGSNSRLSDLVNNNKLEIFNFDIRNEELFSSILDSVDVVFHLAAINGTNNFYKYPELVLDVGIKGMLSVVNGCIKNKIYNLVVASSAEVYQTPIDVPTNEEVALTIPNSSNPRFSYGGSKIISELIAFNYGASHFNKLQIFRPHNVYGPNMGWKHVIPEFIIKIIESKKNNGKLQIKGTGYETRAFCYVDDIVDGIMCMYDFGSHREIYHIGNDSEINIIELANIISKILGLNISFENIDIEEGSTLRRCPDISKMKLLGYRPKINLEIGLAKTVQWYLSNKNFNDNQLL